jgi:hypothetical protein
LRCGGFRLLPLPADITAVAPSALKERHGTIILTCW